MKKRVAQYMIGRDCPACNGKRLKKTVLSVTFAGLDIGEFTHLPLARVAEIMRPIAQGESPGPAGAAGAVLSRKAARADTARRVAVGGSLFVVEHDTQTMRQADWIVDVGPAAGEHGGRVLYSGPPDGLAEIAASRTAAYLFDAPERQQRAPREPSGWLRLTHVSRNNLHRVDAEIPLGCFTAVTGVSGSGKSSLVSQALLCGRATQETRQTERGGGQRAQTESMRHRSVRLESGAFTVTCVVPTSP